jgi:hypothetical protein
MGRNRRCAQKSLMSLSGLNEQPYSILDTQLWPMRMSNFPKLRTLSLFKLELNAEKYLYLFIPRRLRSTLAKFRIGNHDLEIECGRHRNVPVNERYYKLCQSQDQLYIEDEYHVLLKCPFYNDLRCIYLDVENNPVNICMNTFI